MAATLLVTRRPLRGTGWLLFRSLLPAWRFFEDVESTADLYFRVAQAGSADYGDWQIALPAPARGVGALLLNARGNLALATHSLVEQLLAELDGCTVDAAPSLTSYRLVQELVKQRLRESGAADSSRYQFRLDSDGALAFVSEGHAL